MLSKILKISISILCILVGISVAYYFFYFLPHKEALRVEASKQRIRSLQLCLESAEAKYIEKWGDECSVNGENSDCSLDADLSDSLKKRRTDLESYCLRAYD